MPITDDKPENQAAPSVALSKEDLVAGIADGLKQAGVGVPVAAKTQEQTISNFQKVFSKYQGSKESDPQLVEAIGELFSAFNQDVEARTSQATQTARDTAAIEGAKRDISSTIIKLAGDNAGVKAYAGSIGDRVFNALAVDPAARREFERDGFFSPESIAKFAEKEVKLLAPEPVTTKAAGGVAGGANAREQAALSKGASDDSPGGGDIEPRNEDEREMLNGATISIQKAGIPLRDAKDPKKYSPQAAEFLAKKLSTFRAGKEKSRAKAAAR